MTVATDVTATAETPPIGDATATRDRSGDLAHTIAAALAREGILSEAEGSTGATLRADVAGEPYVITVRRA